MMKNESMGEHERLIKLHHDEYIMYYDGEHS